MPNVEEALFQLSVLCEHKTEELERHQENVLNEWISG